VNKELASYFAAHEVLSDA